MFNANYLDLLRRINDLAKRAEQLTQEVNNLISQTATQQNVQELYQNIENLQNRLLTVQNEVNNVKTSLSQITQTLFENPNTNYNSLLNRLEQAEQTLDSLQNVVSQVRNTLDQKANVDLSNVSRDLIRDVINSIQGINADTLDGFHASQTPAPNTILTLNDKAQFPRSVVPFFLTFKNKIINGSFQVWQRGVSGDDVSAPSYTVDRWLVWAESGPVVFDWKRAIDQDFLQAGLPFALKIKRKSGTGRLVLCQFIEGLDQFIPNEYVAVSFYAKSSSSSYQIEVALQGSIGRFNQTTTETVSKTLTISPQLRRFTVVLRVPDYSTLRNLPSYSYETSALVLKIRIKDPVDDYFYISGVQLEKSDVATDFEFLPYEIELFRCLRYYERTYGMALYKGGDDTIGYVNWKVPKRVNPSITFISPRTGAVGKMSYSYCCPTFVDVDVYVYINHPGLDSRLGVLFGNGRYTPPNGNDAHGIAIIIGDAEF